MCCECKGPKSDFSLLKETLDTYAKVPGSLITILQKAQDIYGYLPIEVQKVIAEGMNIPLAEVYGVVTFYAQFSLKPKGTCQGTFPFGFKFYETVRSSFQVLKPTVPHSLSPATTR